MEKQFLTLLLLTLALTACSSISENKIEGIEVVSLPELLANGEKYHQKRISVSAYIYEMPYYGTRSLIEKSIAPDSWAESKTTIYLWAEDKQRKSIHRHKIMECIRIVGMFEQYSLVEYVTTADTKNVTGQIRVQQVSQCAKVASS